MNVTSKIGRSDLKRVQVVLVRAENPINIGQAARAMKNFGLSKLVLVRSTFHRVPEAYTPGWKARTLLDRAVVKRSLGDVIKGVSLAIGFTTRAGRRRGAPKPFVELIPQVLEMVKHQKVALVFGNEKNGLSNEELAKCHLMATIPAVKEYSSLNLSHAVAISASFLFHATQEAREIFKKPERFHTTPEDF